MIHFHPDPFHLTLFFVGVLCLVCALLAKILQSKLHVSETIPALVTGIILGPHVSGLILTKAWGIDPQVALGHLATLMLALQLMSLAYSITCTWNGWRECFSLSLVLGPGFLCSWALSSLVALLLFRISILEAMCFGACLAPIDPVQVASMLRGRFVQDHIPSRLAWLLGAESTFQHAFALLILTLGTLFLRPATPIRTSVTQWVYDAFLYEFLGAILVGALIGTAVGLAFALLTRYELAEHSSREAVSSLLACVLAGGSAMIGMNALLVVTTGGIAMALRQFPPNPSRSMSSMRKPSSLFPSPPESISENPEDAEDEDDAYLPHSHDHILPAPTRHVSERLWHVEVLHWAFYCVLGASIPFSSFSPTDILIAAHLFALSLLLLLFRRLPSAILLYMMPRRWKGGVRCAREALWFNWYGPVGAASLHLALEALRNIAPYQSASTSTAGATTTTTPTLLNGLWPAVTFAAMISILLQGSSIPSLLLFRGATHRKSYGAGVREIEEGEIRRRQIKTATLRSKNSLRKKASLMRKSPSAPLSTPSITLRDPASAGDDILIVDPAVPFIICVPDRR